MKTNFKLVGLSKMKSATLLSLDGNDTFNSPLAMSQDRFNALFSYFKNGGEWTGRETALIEHTAMSEDGIPIDPIVISVDNL